MFDFIQKIPSKIGRWAAFIVLMAIAFGLGRMSPNVVDESQLNPKILSFYKSDEEAYIYNNGYIAMFGLMAPVHAKDSYVWGLELVRKNKTDANAVDNFLKSTPDKTEFKGDTRSIQCWLDQKWIRLSRRQPNTPPDACKSDSELLGMVRNNQLLLTRYKKALDHLRFYNMPYNVPVPSRLLVNVQELFVANLVYESRKNPEAALKDWLANIQFYRRALADQNTWLIRSLLLANYSIAARSLPSLLAADNTLAESYAVDLREALAPFGPAQMRVDLALKAGYLPVEVLISRLSYQNRNQLFQYDTDVIALAKVPAESFPQAAEAFQKKYPLRECVGDSIDIRDASEALIVDYLESCRLPLGELFAAMHIRDAENRLLSLYVQIKAQRLPADGIQRFLSQAPKELYNPFTNTPFKYSPSSGFIYFNPKPDLLTGFWLG